MQPNNPRPLFDLSGKVAIVTGASKGIGRATAERLAEHGACVVIASRNAKECEAVSETINARTGRQCAIAIGCDIRDRASLTALVDSTATRLGSIDILVSNASLAPEGSIESFDEKVFADVLTVNVLHNAVLARLVLPFMKTAGGGSMVFVTATSAIVPRPPRMVYGTSKAALAHLARTLSVDLGRYNIRVNAVAPGLIRTDISKPLWTHPDALRDVVRNAPLNRIGEPDEIAASILFLASPGGAYITGQTIVVDGGYTLQGSAPAASGSAMPERTDPPGA